MIINVEICKLDPLPLKIFSPFGHLFSNMKAMESNERHKSQRKIDDLIVKILNLLGGRAPCSITLSLISTE